MLKTLQIALRITLLTLVLTGLVYPLVGTALAQLFFPSQANGSLRSDEQGQVVGSALIGQAYANAGYFWGRPSAAGEHGYDPLASGGSNLGATSKKLRDRAAEELARLVAANPDAPLPVPSELVTASGSGLDPELSPEATFWQVSRIARARQVAPQRLRDLVATSVQGRTFGVLGEPRVNLLSLNLALDRQFGRPTR